MIGRPRITLITVAATPDSNRFADTRISASTRPSRVLSTNEHTVISTVTIAPFSRIGRNSTAFCTNMANLLNVLTASFDLPLVDDLTERAVGLDLADARVELFEHR